MTATIERIDVADLDLATAQQLAAVDNAALDGVPLRHHTAETFLLDCRDRDGEGPDAGLWLAHEGEELVGYAALTLNLFENLDGAKILGAVHPDHRRRGTGRLLMEAAEAATDRPRLRAPTWVGTAGVDALPRLGYTRGSSHEVRRLSLRAPQPAELVAAAEEASRDYDLELFAGPAPDQLRADLVPLREAINDAPDEGEYEAYPPERIRRYEESLARRRQTPYTIVARHRATGEAAGITMLCVHDLRPEIAAQEDTSVLAAHRGRRLGLRMKLAMLDWLRTERRDVESVDTWNMPGNAPMIAINEALGCRLVAETVRFTKSRP
ncbi:MAG TPA: GNAT family N-acetyltransferase [Nocardioides sp.]|uniref:GNAT family N-acetyltransferase n=1 Tax=Nocardioides sp. TaxID=35761 RepID=UPI002F409123